METTEIVEIRPFELYIVGRHFVLLGKDGQPICDCEQADCAHGRKLLEVLKMVREAHNPG